MRYRELECEACQTRLKLNAAETSEDAEAWHASCPKRKPRGNLPRYVPTRDNAH